MLQSSLSFIFIIILFIAPYLSVKTKSMICGVALAIVAAGVGFIMGTSRSTGSTSNLLLRHLSSSSPEDDSLQRDHHDGRALKTMMEPPSHMTKHHYIPATHTYKNSEFLLCIIRYVLCCIDRDNLLVL